MRDFTKILPDVRAHAAREQPRECCGVVVVKRGRLRYVPCRNLASDGAEFLLDPADWAKAEDAGEIVAICHSHPFTPALPSMADLTMCEQTGLPWLIVNYPTGAWHLFEPSNYQAPLVGRPFVHGVHDCYSLARDYYRQTLGLEMPDYARDDEWWLKGGDLYRAHFEQAGFVMMGDGDYHDIRIHDGLLLQIASPVPNHAAVVVEGGMILQHCQGRLSSRDVFGGYWRTHTTHVLRHRSLL